MGGSGVIGSAICRRFAEANWKVGIHFHRHEEAAQTLYTHLQEKHHDSCLFRADVRNSQQVDTLMTRFRQHWGRLDALVWAVGQAANNLAVRVSHDQWESLIEANLTGLFFCLRSIGPLFHAQRSGSVLILSSLASTKGNSGQTAYAATKAGVLGLVRSVAQEWGSSNIRVNAVFPGWHYSRLSEKDFPSPGACHDHMLGRTPDLKETADHIYHLATAKDISGQTFNLDSRIA